MVEADLDLVLEMLEGLHRESRLLLVDPEGSIAQELLALLRDDPRFKVDLIRDPMEALSKLEQDRYDIVLIAGEVGEFSGEEFARLVRTGPRHRLTPVIFVERGERDRDRVREAFEAGGYDVIFLPIRREELISRLENMTRINHLQQRLMELNHRLAQLANYDALTGVANRRHFLDRFRLEVERARRYHRPLGVLLLDIDHFKRINDNHGHQAGDEVLRWLGKLLRENFRKVDLIGRLGGEEFMVLLPETSPEGLAKAAERFRARVAADPLFFQGEEIPFTISIGGLSRVPGEEETASTLYSEADALLYEAKRAGRNCIRLPAGHPAPPAS